MSGAPAFGVDFIDKAYGAFPWLVLAVLVISYLILLRAFRSVVLPAKAVVRNLLSVGATYGVLVLAFQHGWGEPFGLQQSDQIDGWIPIFLFAMLFGLSMDYEVFLLSRVREEWDRSHDNEHAVAFGLEHTGRIITAAAIIMIAAFSGFLAGSFIVAGTSTARTTVASSSTAADRPRPNSWRPTKLPARNPENAAIMMIAAAVMMRPVCSSP